LSGNLRFSSVSIPDSHHSPKCDGFMIASTKTDQSLGTVQIDHDGEEKYENIWQKIRSVWSYVYDNYYNDYDWFHIGGDDLYVIVENLRLYLESDVIRSAANGGGDPLSSWDEPYQTPLFLGRRFAEGGDMKRIFNSGGSGYTMNKAALKALVRSFPVCRPNLKTFAEDVMVAECFRNQGILPFPTRDLQGGERYMPFLPGHHYGYRPPKTGKDWYPTYAVEELKVGVDHCAEHSVAFHYATPDLMKRIHSILYGYCD
jgi:glycoprotein-N-acetylgalactosamine 3-beta-galactosyltransferase